MTNARGYFSSTCKALLHKLGCFTILNMPQHHHGRMLGSSQFIKLIMVSTTKIKETLTSVEEFTINFLCIIIQNSDGTAEAINLFLRRTIRPIFPSRLLLLHIFKHLVFAVFHNLLRYHEILRLGIFAIQEGNNKTFLHTRDGLTELFHYRVCTPILVVV